MRFRKPHLLWVGRIPLISFPTQSIRSGPLIGLAYTLSAPRTRSYLGLQPAIIKLLGVFRICRSTGKPNSFIFIVHATLCLFQLLQSFFMENLNTSCCKQFHRPTVYFFQICVGQEPKKTGIFLYYR